MGVVVAIHQPNFFPWLGFFNKLARCDVFVLLDNVQFPKTGGSWMNRVKILVHEEAKWLSAPIDRSYHGLREVKDMQFHQDPRWRGKVLKTLEASYRRAPYFQQTISLVGPLILNAEDNIARYNEHLIRTLAAALGVTRAKILRASDLGVSGTSNELLIAVTLASGGQAYMCGGGADSYQDEGAFERANVSLVRQDFRHPQYVQHKRQCFTPGLSIIDALVNLGVEGVSDVLLER